MGRRLRVTVRTAETVARLGGDEFVVVSPMVADASGLTNRLRSTIGEPITLGQEASVHVAVSIGVAFAGSLEQPTSDTLPAAADAAMYDEKALTSTY